MPTDRDRRERRRAEKRLETEYGWPKLERRGVGWLYSIALVFLAFAVIVAIHGAERFWWWAPFVEAGMPAWWPPLALAVAGLLLAGIAAARRHE